MVNRLSFNRHCMFNFVEKNFQLIDLICCKMTFFVNVKHYRTYVDENGQYGFRDNQNKKIYIF